MLHNPRNDYTLEGKLLLDAADYMDQHGHCKYMTWDPEGRVCLAGALIKVGAGSGMKILTHDTEDRLIDILELIRPNVGGQHPIDWNNAEERTGEEVINMLRLTAEGQKITALV